MNLNRYLTSFSDPVVFLHRISPNLVESSPRYDDTKLSSPKLQNRHHKITWKNTFKRRKATSHGRKAICPICHEEVGVLKQHMATHAPKQKCSVCHKMIGQRSIRNHLEAHRLKKSFEQQSNPKPEICDTCGSTLNSEEELRM